MVTEDIIGSICFVGNKASGFFLPCDDPAMLH